MAPLKIVFIAFILPVLIIVLYIIIGFFIKLYIEYKKGLMDKNNIFKDIDIKYAKIDTVKNALDNIENYHKIKYLTEDILIFMNEFEISIIMVKNYYGQLIGKNTDETLTMKSDKEDQIVKNPKMRLDSVVEEIKDKLEGYEYNLYLVIGSMCVTSLKFPGIKIVRMKEFYYYINKILVTPKYTKEEIDNFFTNLDK